MKYNIFSKKHNKKSFLYLIFIIFILTTISSCKNNTALQNEQTTIQENITIQEEEIIINEKPSLHEFLSNAIKPLGTTLYIYGGGWSYDEIKGDKNSMTLGIAPSWKEFFDSQNEWFVYKDSKHKKTSYFPFDGKNTHHEKGLDCSGYLGWIFYNTFEEEGSDKNYVYNTNIWLDTFTNEYKLGTKEIPTGDNIEKTKSISAGDIILIDRHVYIVIGKCPDDSIVILHSTVTQSITGAYGGGIQLSAINVKNSENKNCEAYELADYYMTTYFKEWHRRYPTVVKPTNKYLNFSSKIKNFGIFHFDYDNIINDNEGLREMEAKEVLETIFRE